MKARRKISFSVPSGKKTQFLRILDNQTQRIDRPFSFEPLGMILGRKVKGSGIYGDVNEDGFWLRAYNESWYEPRMPGRYCQGSLEETPEGVNVSLKWKITPYWPLAWLIIYFIMSWGLSPLSRAGAIFFLIALAIVISQFLLGFALHKKEEQQVTKLVEAICNDLSAAEQTEFIDQHIEMLEQFNRELIRGGEQ